MCYIVHKTKIFLLELFGSINVGLAIMWLIFEFSYGEEYGSPSFSFFWPTFVFGAVGVFLWGIAYRIIKRAENKKS